MILQDVCAKLEEHSPLRYMAEWDNSGLQVGGRQQEIRSILITLDVTDEAIDYAIDARADLILSHHPLIFSALKSVTEEDLCGRRILKLIRHHICCYAMHTNFDVMGMADAAADALGLKKCEVLEVTYEDEVSKEGFGRVGELSSPMRAGEYAGHVKKSFSLDHVVFYGDRDALIERVAICPGSGRSIKSPGDKTVIFVNTYIRIRKSHY